MFQPSLSQSISAISIALTLGFSSLSAATEINLYGSILDHAGNPVPGVTLTLKTAKLSTTSDADGEWSFLQRTTSLLGVSQNYSSMRESAIYNVQGKLLSGASLARGSYIKQESANNAMVSAQSLSKVTAAEDSLFVTYKNISVGKYHVPNLTIGAIKAYTLARVQPQVVPASAGSAALVRMLVGQPVQIQYQFDETLWRSSTLIVDGKKFPVQGNSFSFVVETAEPSVSLQLKSRVQNLLFPTITTKTYGDTFSVNPSVAANLPIEITSKSLSVCVVQGKVVSLINTGFCELLANQKGNDSLNAATATQKFEVKAKTLTLVDLLAENKAYDGNTAVMVRGSITGIVGNDQVELDLGTGSFDNKNAGADKVVTVSGMSLKGTDASKYILPTIGTLKASIIPKRLTISNAVVSSKVYDGTTTATISAKLVGIIGTDEVQIVYGPSYFNSSQPGARTVTSEGTGLSGADASNYTRTKIGFLQGTILKRPITLGTVNVTKAFGETAALDPAEFSLVSGTFVAGDLVQSVELSSAGSPDTAAVGEYEIEIRNAQGTGLENYEIQYQNALLTVISE